MCSGRASDYERCAKRAGITKNAQCWPKAITVLTFSVQTFVVDTRASVSIVQCVHSNWSTCATTSKGVGRCKATGKEVYATEAFLLSSFMGSLEVNEELWWMLRPLPFTRVWLYIIPLPVSSNDSSVVWLTSPSKGRRMWCGNIVSSSRPIKWR